MRALDKQLATLQLGYHFDQVLHWESFIADLVYCCHQRKPTVVYMGAMIVCLLQIIAPPTVRYSDHFLYASIILKCTTNATINHCHFLFCK